VLSIKFLYYRYPTLFDYWDEGSDRVKVPTRANRATDHSGVKALTLWREESCYSWCNHLLIVSSLWDFLSYYNVKSIFFWKHLKRTSVSRKQLKSAWGAFLKHWTVTNCFFKNTWKSDRRTIFREFISLQKRPVDFWFFLLFPHSFSSTAYFIVCVTKSGS